MKMSSSSMYRWMPPAACGDALNAHDRVHARVHTRVGVRARVWVGVRMNGDGSKGGTGVCVQSGGQRGADGDSDDRMAHMGGCVRVGAREHQTGAAGRNA